MKIATLSLGGLLLAGSLAAFSASASAQDALSKTELSPDSNYCHIQFPAMRPSTLNTDDRSLKRPGTGDVVDFYGPCDESPVGGDQAWSQQLDFEHRLSSDYSN